MFWLTNCASIFINIMVTWKINRWTAACWQQHVDIGGLTREPDGVQGWRTESLWTRSRVAWGVRSWPTGRGGDYRRWWGREEENNDVGTWGIVGVHIMIGWSVSQMVSKVICQVISSTWWWWTAGGDNPSQQNELLGSEWILKTQNYGNSLG